MTYQLNGLIQASDFNAAVGNFNAIYGSGSGNTGYGQSILGTVTAGNKVSYGNWNDLVTKVKAIASHQGSTTAGITALDAPQTGDAIVYMSGLTSAISTVTSNKLNAATQGTSSTTVTAATSTWVDTRTFTTTVSFASGAAARYFFNAGGQLAITPYHPTGSGINSLFSGMATAMGTIKMSAQSGVTLAGVTYDGITKVGGSGVVNTNYSISSATGFYNLLTTDTQIFRQEDTGALSKYVDSFISVNARIDATGSIIRFTTLFDSNWSSGSGLTVGTGTQLTVTVIPPATTYLTNTWGTPAVATSYL